MVYTIIVIDNHSQIKPSGERYFEKSVEKKF